MTPDAAMDAKPTPLMRTIGALAGAMLGVLLAVSLLHFVKLACVRIVLREPYLCSMLTWFYVGLPVVALSALAAGIRGLLVQSRREYTQWMETMAARDIRREEG